MLLGAVAVTLLAGCGGEPKQVVNPGDSEDSAAVAEYDPSREPSAAVLSLVPDDATTLQVTDFDQIRLSLGFGSLTGRAPEAERAAFWRRFGTTASFSDGLLRPVEGRLGRLGLHQDDVAWEATYTGDADGWVMAFHPKVPADRISRAIRAGIGPLRGASFDAERGIVSSAELPDPGDSWAAVDGLPDLVGRQANATYVERGCVPLDDIYGDGIVDQLGGQTKVDVAGLRELDTYSVALGDELATIQLGPDRSDGFTRLRLYQHLPELQPDFGAVFERGAADPGSGRLGYDIPRPDVAADWVRERRLPFAACDVAV